MKKSGYTEEQIAFALKQAETGAPVSEVTAAPQPTNPLAAAMIPARANTCGA